MNKPPPSCAPSSDPLAVSIVDDCRDDCFSLKRTVDRTPGLEWAATYYSGQTALQWLPQSNTRIVLMDIRLPGLSGTECLRRLKADSPEIVVIMVTGFDDPQAVATALAAGAADCLIKPLGVGTLLVSVCFAFCRSRGRNHDSGDIVDGAQGTTASPETITGPGALLVGFLKRAQRWRVPPNWSAGDWLKELEAQAAASFWRAGRDYDESRGLAADVFVYFRALADLTSRYRKEWAYASTRCRRRIRLHPTHAPG